ncbi:DUF4124 domain-containing protein [Motilimonas cestriensis]|uniref:DUF4124 domain-containing protein n=1 Tax=Motilimonas cestriensis TaxID=2742685 RepID=A0ABS8WH09_9GAMM|nr:DUF4124 domain-containing protein [Motilimonas cestriensis]MCE2596921.1 DUF4124 domain-containing protein [Motilimonas cestriensis]
MKKWLNAIAFTLMMALVSQPSMAKKVYKWVDEQGVTHYSDSTPASAMSDTHNVNQVSVTEDLPSGNYRGVAKKPTYTSLSSQSEKQSAKKQRGKDPATQCYSAIKNLTAGLKSIKQQAKKRHMSNGMKENEFEKKYAEAMKKIESAKSSCVESYETGKSRDIDCLANLSHPDDFVYCVYASRLTGFSGY